MYYLYYDKEPKIRLYLITFDCHLKILKFGVDLDPLVMYFVSREEALKYSLKVQREFGIILSIDKRDV